MNAGAKGEQNYWQQHEELEEQQLAESASSPQATQSEPIAWQASEAIHHEKHPLWFMGLIIVAAILLTISIFAVKSWTFSGLIVVMTVAAIIITSRPPRVLSYSLSPQTLKINDQVFHLYDFRAFGVVQEGALYSAVLIPNKRFMPAVTVYFPAEQGEKIVDMFGGTLPMERIEPDLLDKIARTLRF